MVRVQAKPRFTAAELAEEFGVSRRTILRDLQTLLGLGVPLRSTPGPGGGYSLPRGGRRLTPSLTVDEALAAPLLRGAAALPGAPLLVRGDLCGDEAAGGT